MYHPLLLELIMVPEARLLLLPEVTRLTLFSIKSAKSARDFCFFRTDTKKPQLSLRLKCTILMYVNNGTRGQTTFVTRSDTPYLILNKECKECEGFLLFSLDYRYKKASI
jgi:hypothetical protein